MNISNIRDCSPSEVPNFGTDVPNLRTFLRFFLLSEIRRRRISGRPRKRACAKIHPRSDLHLPRIYTGIYPRFSHTYSETFHPSSEILYRNLSEIFAYIFRDLPSLFREQEQESKQRGKRTCCLLATKSPRPCRVEPQFHVALLR